MLKKNTTFLKKTLYNKLIGFITKKGNKINAVNIINTAFFKVSTNMNLSMHRILLELFFKLNSFVEVKNVRVKRSFHLVPFQITLKRRSYLIIKWLMQAVKQDTRNISIIEKLVFEIEQTLKTDSSKALQLRNANITSALANRSNLHYRW
jgi:ribosomal protein S7